ncbi:MAG: TetR/AcrR family transcriptional regulator [Solirubrobacterales bacterium]
MARWKPDSRGRLLEAALDLYAERGFEQTTVAQIAKRAGLTERTYFRHFPDKREILFGSAGELQAALVGAVADADDSLAPIDVVGSGLEAVPAVIPDRETARRRQAIIAANPELQERELTKFASLSAAVADALRHRGVKDPAAKLAGEAGMAAFRIAFDRWVEESNGNDLRELIRESIDELKVLAVDTAV